MPPVLIRRGATGDIEEIGNGSLPLGSRLPARYEEIRTALHDGDTILFATDGFAEQSDEENRQLGYPGAAAALQNAARAGSAGDVIERLVASAAQFRGNRVLEDDMTFVVVRVTSE